MGTRRSASLLARLERDRHRIVEGGVPLVTAIWLCLDSDTQAPDWLKREFRRRLASVTYLHEAKSWDQALGKPFPDHYRLDATRRRRFVVIPKIRTAIVGQLMDDPKQPIDKGFWERVGAASGASATTAEDIYRQAIAASNWPGPSIHQLRIEYAIYAALSAVLKQSTPLPIDESLLKEVCELAGLPIEWVREWHASHCSIAQTMGGLDFEPDPKKFPLHRFTPAKLPKLSGSLD